MTLINLDFIQFYQTLTKADLAGKKLSITSIDDIVVIYEEKNASKVSRSSGEWGRRLNNYDLIEVSNSIDSSLKDSSDLFYK